MSKNYNISDIDLNTLNDSTKFFNNIFDQPLSVSSEVDQAILAFFEKKTGNKNSARSLSGALLDTCLSQVLDPMSVL